MSLLYSQSLVLSTKKIEVPEKRKGVVFLQHPKLAPRERIGLPV
jgi:hypothetical protein